MGVGGNVIAHVSHSICFTNGQARWGRRAEFHNEGRAPWRGFRITQTHLELDIKEYAMRAKCFLLIVCLTTSVQAQEDLRVLPADGDPPPARMLRQYLLSAAGKHFDARREAIAGLKTPADIAKRQESLRADFLAALGGLPPRTPLNPVVVGRVPRDGYTIEKVIYESRPNHHVTASLYLPEGRGKVPGVLMPIGHSDNGKAADYIQRGRHPAGPARHRRAHATIRSARESGSSC